MLYIQVSVCSLPSAQEVWHRGAEPHTILGQLLGCEEDGEHGLLQPQFLACPCDWKSYWMLVLIVLHVLFRGGDSYSKLGGAHDRQSLAARASALQLRGLRGQAPKGFLGFVGI